MRSTTQALVGIAKTRAGETGMLASIDDLSTGVPALGVEGGSAIMNTATTTAAFGP